MNSLKTLLVIGLLAAGMGGVYMGLQHQDFDGQRSNEGSEPDPWALESPLGGPDVQLTPDSGMGYFSENSELSATDPGSSAPPFAPSDPSNPPLYADSYPPATTEWSAEAGSSSDQPGLYESSSRFGSVTPGPSVPDFRDLPNDPLAVNPLDAAMALPDLGPGQGGMETLCQEFLDLMQGARADLARGNFPEIHEELSRLYEDPQLTPQERGRITDLLDEVAWTVIYSPQSHLERPYEVQPGDTFDSIAKQYDVSGTLLARINGIHPTDTPIAGQEIKVIRGPFDATINLDSFELTLKLQGRYYAGRFGIGIGSDSSQLEGDYSVTKKTVDPPYYAPSGTVVSGGDPTNPLGKYLIRLNDRVGLHGTNDPRHIGSTTGQGSVCLDDRNIEDLYGILTAESRVVIQR